VDGATHIVGPGEPNMYSSFKLQSNSEGRSKVEIPETVKISWFAHLEWGMLGGILL
jgi:hypothetical protein